MIRRKRSDTRVASIERTYGIDLNARSDMTLGTLLDERGFDSISQLLTAYRGHLDYHASSRSVFLSFHREDLLQVSGFRLMMANPRLALDVSDEPTRAPVRSRRSTYVRQALRQRIAQVDVVVCMIGNDTAWREWVEWELDAAASLKKGLCGVRLKGSRGQTPPVLRELHAPVASWEMGSIVRTIECAAARRS